MWQFLNVWLSGQELQTQSQLCYGKLSAGSWRRYVLTECLLGQSQRSGYGLTIMPLGRSQVMSKWAYSDLRTVSKGNLQGVIQRRL